VNWEFTIVIGASNHCAFCRRRLVLRWADGNCRIWACLWHTRRAWRALDSGAGLGC